MTSNSREEGIVNGTIEMLVPLLHNLGAAAGLPWLVFFEMGFSKSGVSHQHFHVERFEGGGANVSFRRLGILELQQLPNQRVLITFRPGPIRGYANEPPHNDADQADYQAMRDVLISRLMQLGFIELPPPPPPEKAPLGFVRKNIDS